MVLIFMIHIPIIDPEAGFCDRILQACPFEARFSKPARCGPAPIEFQLSVIRINLRFGQHPDHFGVWIFSFGWIDLKNKEGTKQDNQENNRSYGPARFRNEALHRILQISLRPFYAGIACTLPL